MFFTLSFLLATINVKCSLLSIMFCKEKASFIFSRVHAITRYLYLIYYSESIIFFVRFYILPNPCCLLSILIRQKHFQQTILIHTH